MCRHYSSILLCVHENTLYGRTPVKRSRYIAITSFTRYSERMSVVCTDTSTYFTTCPCSKTLRLLNTGTSRHHVSRAYCLIWPSAWRTTIWEITETKNTLWLHYWLRCGRCTSTIRISSTLGRNRLPPLQLIDTEEWIVLLIGACADPGTFTLVPCTDVRGLTQLEMAGTLSRLFD
jgi:hypothetical protein